MKFKVEIHSHALSACRVMATYITWKETAGDSDRIAIVVEERDIDQINVILKSVIVIRATSVVTRLKLL